MLCSANCAVDADSDIYAPRGWCETDPGRTGDRLIFAALRAWRPVILCGRFEIHPHARARMAERGITLDQALDAVRDGRIILPTRMYPGEAIRGGYLADSLVVIVGALAPRGVDFRDLVPTLLTVYRNQQLDPAQPLTVPLSAYVAGASGPLTSAGRGDSCVKCSSTN
jgi:hypothetical protein